MLLDLFKLVNFVEFCKDLDVVFFVLDIINVQVFQIIKGISFYKVIGIDKISVRFLCIVVFILVLSIVRFINMLFFIGMFFICWKIVSVILLFKQGVVSDFFNYCLIFVLLVVLKVIECYMYNFLYVFFMDNNLLYYRQFGFCGMYSIEIFLIKLVDEFLFGLDNNCVCGMVLVDY